ncbi:TraU family protein, partial [Escherichia coli]|uniref:TraU family protein n=1 Tax=Escherichia coli TaxID=562 RepID=UPI0015EF6CAB
SEIDPTWTDSSLTTILNPEAVIFANPIAQGACAADAIASAFNMPLDVLFWCAGSQGSMYPFNGWVRETGKNPPNTKKNFGYLMWRKRNCVFL